MKLLRYKNPKQGEIYRRTSHAQLQHLILFRDKNNSIVMVFEEDGTVVIASLDPGPYGIGVWELI